MGVFWMQEGGHAARVVDQGPGGFGETPGGWKWHLKGKEKEALGFAVGW